MFVFSSLPLGAVARRCIPAVAAIVCIAGLADASIITVLEADQQSVGDFTITGAEHPTLGFDIKTHSSDFYVWGKESGAYSSNLTIDPPDGTPSPPNVTTYTAADFDTNGAVTIGDLRTFLAASSVIDPDDFSIFVTVNEVGGEKPAFIDVFEITILNSDETVTHAAWDLNLDTAELTTDAATGQPNADYEFQVTGGMNLGSFLDSDILRFNLSMSGLSNGQEIWWIDTEALGGDPGTLIPEPSTLAIWSLLGLCGIAIGWRRRRTAE